jgi:ankyrin repeat protein
MINALKQGEAEVGKLLDKYPDLVNEISTGGATPLHMCGMSKENQKIAAYLITRGGDINAFDTYGFKPLHRMASNNLAIGAEALLAGTIYFIIKNWYMCH